MRTAATSRRPATTAASLSGTSPAVPSTRHCPQAGSVTALAYDRRHVIAAHDDGTISLWFVDALDTPPIQLVGHSARVNDLVVQADSTYLLSAGDDGAVQRWILAVDALVDTACRGAGRSLTSAERKLYLPRQPAAPTSTDPCSPLVTINIIR